MQFWPYKGRILGPDKNGKSDRMSDLFRTKFLEFGTDGNPQNRGFWDPTFGLKVGGPYGFQHVLIIVVGDIFKPLKLLTTAGFLFRRHDLHYR